MRKNTKALLLAIAITSILVIQACRKFDFLKPSKPETVFTVEDAKEWFYGEFKNGSEFYGTSKNTSSKSTSRIENSGPDTALLNRFPVWTQGEEGTNGFIQIVEVPYLANKVKLQIPDSAGLTSFQINKIRTTTLRKVLFIRKDNQITARVVHIVPGFNYAVSKNFDISQSLSYNLESDFTGWVMTYDWSGKSLMKTQVVNGITKHIYKINGTVSENSQRRYQNRLQTDSTGCGCCGGELGNLGITEDECPVTVVGDIPNNGNGNSGGQCDVTPPTEEEPECGDDVLPPGGGDFPNYPDDPNDPDAPCYGDPNCLCAIYGMGCEYGDNPPGGGGTGGNNNGAYTYNGYTFTATDWQIINSVTTEMGEMDEIYNSPTSACYGTERMGYIQFPGNIEHYLLQLDYLARYSGGLREYSIPRASILDPTNRGFADLANILSKEIFEIKPDNAAGLSAGETEALFYVGKATLECGLGPWGLGTDYVGAIIPNPRDATMVIKSRLAINGVIAYSSQTVNSNPIPVAIPVSVMDKVKELIERLKNTTVAIEVEITSFLRRNPEMLTYIKNAAIGAGVAIIVGTIVQDILTAGMGIADDWASFLLAYRIVRFGLAL